MLSQTWPAVTINPVHLKMKVHHNIFSIYSFIACAAFREFLVGLSLFFVSTAFANIAITLNHNCIATALSYQFYYSFIYDPWLDGQAGICIILTVLNALNSPFRS